MRLAIVLLAATIGLSCAYNTHKVKTYDAQQNVTSDQRTRSFGMFSGKVEQTSKKNGEVVSMINRKGLSANAKELLIEAAESLTATAKALDGL